VCKEKEIVGRNPSFCQVAYCANEAYVDATIYLNCEKGLKQIVVEVCEKHYKEFNNKEYKELRKND